ncbi:Nucleotidyltransferase family protein [Forsythia ovata]|uniref:Nucleotidyltransferase family protein n=1 Tax=Forsythia ovata TaxID=205694 RepID=A0ABD1QP91_9LAMI
MNSRQQLLDSLTAHVSLYHSKIPDPNPNPNPNPNHRPAILKWFSSLSVHHRRAYLTTVNSDFIKILLEMLEKLRLNGPGRFIILPDLPTTCEKDNSTLPTLCYRKLEGLLLRIAQSNVSERVIYESVKLFSSKEGEKNEDGNEFLGVSGNCLNAMGVNEEFVEDVNRFVEMMDGVSGGEFLRGGEEGEMAGEWVELRWLKAKGYYSLEEFIANRMEVTLKLAWLNCNSGKKRGAKLKDRLSASGMAANVFWRKKGCVDWWEKLDDTVKKEVFRTFLGKATKSLAPAMLKGKDCILEDKMWPYDYCGEQPLRCSSTFTGGRDIAKHKGTNFKIKWNVNHSPVSGNSSPLNRAFNSLYILQVISAMLLASQRCVYNQEKLFFSSLDSANSISDNILRKLRELLMVISLDCTRIELLEEGNWISPNKSKEKPVSSNHKKKGKKRNKNSNPVPRPCTDGRNLVEHTWVYSGNGDVKQPNKFDGKVPEEVLTGGDLASADAMGPVKGLNNGNLRSAPRKSRKERKKLKSSSSHNSEVGSCRSRSTRVSAVCVSSQDGPSMADWIPGNSTIKHLSNNVATGIDSPEPNPDHCSSASTELMARCGETCDSYAEVSDSLGLKHHQNPDSVSQNGMETARVDLLNDDVDSDATSVRPVVEDNDDLSSGVIDRGNYAHSYGVHQKTGFLGKLTEGSKAEGKTIQIQEQGSMGNVGATSSSAYVSYEWPNVATMHPSASTHLPTATDRLHLDVGHNWQNHFHRSFVQNVQVRNSPIDTRYSGVVSRHLPMSLDWPPVLHGVNRLSTSVTCNYDSDFISRRQSSLLQRFTAQRVQCGPVNSEDERVLSGEFMDMSDVTNSQEPVDEHDNHWMSEEELEVHAVSGLDCNQHFGGGVMYWNPSDHPGTSFSRPPSLCSDDSSWAWREADMNRAVDDMVAFSSSYSTNGLTSPSAASFCSPFDPLGPGALGYVMPGSDISSKLLHSSSAMNDVDVEEIVSGSIPNISGDGEAKAGDSLPYPILRPIIIPNMSRDRSRSDFKQSYDRKSPCVPPNRREQPRIKRPPSPVVLCVPRAPHPPPPSPVGDSRKHKGFPSVRSGSSSPRHWGVKGWFHDGVSFEEACLPMNGSEVVWPSWRNKSLSARQLTQPLAGALLTGSAYCDFPASSRSRTYIAFPLQPPDPQNCSIRKASLSLFHNTLHDEINSFCKQVAAENLIRKPYINWAVKCVARSLQVLWPRSRTNVFGSNATGLSLPSSDVDLVVCLPPVRNLEPIKEAGILEGRNGIKETCFQHAARYLANQEWVKSDSLKIVENTAIPVIMLVVEVPHDLVSSTMSNVPMIKEAHQGTGEQGNLFQADSAGSEISTSAKWSKLVNDNNSGVKFVRLDISFKSPSHTGLQTTGLVKEITEQFPAATPLALLLKQFLADRSLDQSYSGGLSSYCLILLITRFLQHEHHHGRPINQNYGSLLMDFLYFYGNVFDSRQMRISVQGSGVYLTRERGCSIDPLYVDDPLFPTNNVGRNCFRIHQCIKAFADAYSVLQNELTCFPDDDTLAKPPTNLLPKIVPSIGHLTGF